MSPPFPAGGGDAQSARRTGGRAARGGVLDGRGWRRARASVSRPGCRAAPRAEGDGSGHGARECWGPPRLRATVRVCFRHRHRLPPESPPARFETDFV